MAKPAIVIVQGFTYRDLPEEFSNKYFFAGSAPSSAAGWVNVANTLMAALAPCFSTATRFHRAYGYTDGDNPSVWSHDWVANNENFGGGLPTTGAWAMPGDVAATVRWASDKRNSRGKVIYARKYYHDVYAFLSGAEHDKLWVNQSSAILTFAGKLLDGSILPGNLCLPDGTPVHTPAVDPWLTTRTLKRRGKRPPT